MIVFMKPASLYADLKQIDFHTQLFDKFGKIPKPTVKVRMGEGLAKARIIISCRSQRQGI